MPLIVVGGDETPRGYAVLFAVGVYVGSVVRAGTFVLPRRLVSTVIDRLR